jgi:hypothetical protein
MRILAFSGGLILRRNQHSDAPHPVGLLRRHRERPSGGRAAEKRDELAPPFKMTDVSRHRSVDSSGQLF